MSNASNAMIERVEAVLSDIEGKSPKEIHEAHGIGAIQTTKMALSALELEGRARHEGPDGKRLYFKVPNAGKRLVSIHRTQNLPQRRAG